LEDSSRNRRKGPDVDLRNLPNKEKTLLVDALGREYSAKNLPKALHFAGKQLLLESQNLEYAGQILKAQRTYQKTV